MNQPKYKIGDEVWIARTNSEYFSMCLKKTIITEIIQTIRKEGTSFVYGSGDARINELFCFPTKEAAKEYLINKIKQL